jgi:hypothetical protein
VERLRQYLCLEIQALAERGVAVGRATLHRALADAGHR